jgi:hypothetical protein
MTIISFVAAGVVFIILSFFGKRIWIYYIPATLLILSFWVKATQFNWDDPDPKGENYFLVDSVGAAFITWAISFIYGIVCIFLGDWIAFAVCVIIFLFSLTYVKTTFAIVNKN